MPLLLPMPYPPLLRASPGRPRYLRGVGWSAPVSEVELSGCSLSSFWGACSLSSATGKISSALKGGGRGNSHLHATKNDEGAPEPGSPRFLLHFYKTRPVSQAKNPPYFQRSDYKEKTNPNLAISLRKLQTTIGCGTDESRCPSSRPRQKTT